MGQNGFEELRKHVKQGSELCKDVCLVLQERSDLETNYAKGLSRLASKLLKATPSCLGSVTEAWSLVGAEMEAEAEEHRQFVKGINNDIYALLKNLQDAHLKARKTIEATVDKCAKTLNDRRDAEIKCKKAASNTTKDREKAYAAAANVRDTAAKNAEKEAAKLEKKLKQLDEQQVKADADYFDSCKKAELGRAEYDTAVFKACDQLQKLEEERICHMRDCLNKYKDLLSALAPRLEKSSNKLAEAALSINAQKDIQLLIDKKGVRPRMSEQILLDFCAEDMHVNMDVSRRKQELQYLTAVVAREVEREMKAQEALDKMNEVYQTQQSFADDQTRDEVVIRQNNVGAMLRWLDACSYKLTLAMSSVEGFPKPESQLTQYLVSTKDKQGLIQTVLRYPCEERTVELRPGVSARTAVSTFYNEEFSESEAIGTCRALYAFNASQYDELTIHPGDVITIVNKLADGWWQGEINGKFGVFPSTYVEEIQ